VIHGTSKKREKILELEVPEIGVPPNHPFIFGFSMISTIQPMDYSHFKKPPVGQRLGFEILLQVLPCPMGIRYGLLDC
jgi:hypothetical protein